MELISDSGDHILARWIFVEYTRSLVCEILENGKTTIQYTLRVIYVYDSHSMYVTGVYRMDGCTQRVDVMWCLYMYILKRENVKFSSSPYTKYLRLILYGILYYLEKEIDALARRQTKWGKQGAHTEYRDGDTMDGWMISEGLRGNGLLDSFWGK